VGTADANFECNAILSCQPVCYVDVEIGKRNEQVIIVTANCVTTVMVFTPGLIVVPSLPAKGGHDSGQVVGVFSTHVLFDDLQPSTDAVTQSSSHSSSRCSEKCQPGSVPPNHALTIRIDDFTISGTLQSFPPLNNKTHASTNLLAVMTLEDKDYTYAASRLNSRVFAKMYIVS
jgi:hypothetical protein